VCVLVCVVVLHADSVHENALVGVPIVIVIDRVGHLALRVVRAGVKRKVLAGVKVVHTLRVGYKYECVVASDPCFDSLLH
jgi:hypothetical protein